MTDDANPVDRVLPRALESPDPVIRNIAIRYEELQREQDLLDNFLKGYAVLSSGQPISAVKMVVRKTPAAPKQQADFSREAVDIILEHGSPMTFGQFREAYAAVHGAEPEQNVRKRLKRLENITNVEGRGLWPVNTPLPNGPVDEGGL